MLATTPRGREAILDRVARPSCEQRCHSIRIEMTDGARRYPRPTCASREGRLHGPQGCEESDECRLRLETPRLRLTPWAETDAALLARLSSVPSVMRFVGSGELWSAEVAERVATKQQAHWRRHGFGWRTAADKATGEALGFAALNLVGEGTGGLEATELEVGWWLHPAAWGRGLAREAAAAMRDEAFARLDAESVIARIQPGNVRSIVVAEARRPDLRLQDLRADRGGRRRLPPHGGRPRLRGDVTGIGALPPIRSPMAPPR